MAQQANPWRDVGSTFAIRSKTAFAQRHNAVLTKRIDAAIANKLPFSMTAASELAANAYEQAIREHRESLGARIDQQVIEDALAHAQVFVSGAGIPGDPHIIWCSIPADTLSAAEVDVLAKATAGGIMADHENAFLCKVLSLAPDAGEPPEPFKAYAPALVSEALARTLRNTPAMQDTVTRHGAWGRTKARLRTLLRRKAA